MSYIRFNKLKTPFKPSVRQVIYFDVTGVGDKVFYHVLGDGYQRIRQLFKEAGLEFVFLPRIADNMDLRKIYLYFKPNATEQEIQYFKFSMRNTDLLAYIDEDLKEVAIKPGLIQYMGSDWDEPGYYTFSYEPLPEEMAQMMFYDPEKGIGLVVSDYISRHSLTGKNDFSRSRYVGIEGLVARQMKAQISSAPVALSRIRVRHGRVFLTDYKSNDGREEMEVKMPALSRAIYLLYLRHPEGIAFKNLSLFSDELLEIYSAFTGREDQKDVKSSIDALVDPTSNSVSEKCSRIRQAFRKCIDASIASNYCIEGKQGEIKKISLDPKLIIWE